MEFVRAQREAPFSYAEVGTSREGAKEVAGYVVDHFDLDRRQSRCMECNGELEVAPPGAVAGRVPPGVIRDHDEFFVCGGCGRVFWHGSHWDRISGRLSRVFG